MSAGLTLCRDLCDHFWEGLHPARLKPRRAALEWISERMSVLLEPATLRPQDHVHITTALGVVEDLWSRYNDKFEGEDCGWATLRRKLGEIQAGNAPPAGEPAAGEAGSGDAQGAAGGSGYGGGGGGGGGGTSGPVGNRAAAIQRLHEVAAYFSTYEPHSPVGHLVNRAIHWSQISFEELFGELLKDRQDAQDHVWSTLGIKKPEPEATNNGG